MIKEYYCFIKNFLLLAELKTAYVVINVVSAFFYKAFEILIPFSASLIIKSLDPRYDCVLPLPDGLHPAFFFLFVLFVLYLLYSLTLFINYKVYALNLNRCYGRLTQKILNKLLNVDSNFARSVSKGRLMNSINGDIMRVGDMCDQLVEVIAGIIQIASVIIIVFCQNWLIGLIFLLFAGLFITACNRADRKTLFYHNKLLTENDRYSSLLSQTLSGLSEVKSFNLLPKLKHRLTQIQERFGEAYCNKRHYITVRDIDTEAITFFFRFLLYLLLLFLLAEGRGDLSLLVLIISYHANLTAYINSLIGATSSIRETSVSINRLNAILDYNAKVIRFGNVDLDDIRGVVEFKNVSLRLEGQTILNKINFKVKHNEVFAIVGETGSGKTALFDLLLRLHRPTRGQITIDGINIFRFTPKVYANNLTAVNQKPFIFNLSIRKNLDFVDPNIEHQIEACKIAGIHDFIDTLPMSYNTILHEDGNNISGGQKQMLSIARTILSKAEIILFDDVTTSLDPETAKLVPRLIKKLRKDHTILLITKQPELMELADRVLVVANGRVDDLGPHAKLITRNITYRDLHSYHSDDHLKEPAHV